MAASAVKAMALNGLGFVSAPLYLYAAFFKGKATEPLLGDNIAAEMLNDDLVGRTLDRLFNFGVSRIFSLIAMSAFKRFGLEPKSHHLDSTVKVSVNNEAIADSQQQAGRFILSTHILDEQEYSASALLTRYKQQQYSERGWRFLKDPLFFTSSVFLKTPQRILALAMVMGLALMVYTLAKRQVLALLGSPCQKYYCFP